MSLILIASFMSSRIDDHQFIYVNVSKLIKQYYVLSSVLVNVRSLLGNVYLIIYARIQRSAQMQYNSRDYTEHRTNPPQYCLVLNQVGIQGKAIQNHPKYKKSSLPHKYYTRLSLLWGVECGPVEKMNREMVLWCISIEHAFLIHRYVLTTIMDFAIK